MNYGNPQGALNQYRQVGVQTGIMEASPHRLIQMLMEGALDKIHTAKGHMKRGEIGAKGKQISWAISIIEGLRASLDLQGGGQIAANLNALYEYMNRRLLEANLHNHVEKLDEVGRLLSEIKQGWDAIPDEVKNAKPGATVHMGRQGG